MGSNHKYGARVYFQGQNAVLIKQTHKSAVSGEFVLTDPKEAERHLRIDDVQGIARALRLAKEGKLSERD